MKNRFVIQDDEHKITSNTITSIPELTPDEQKFMDQYDDWVSINHTQFLLIEEKIERDTEKHLHKEFNKDV